MNKKNMIKLLSNRSYVILNFFTGTPEDSFKRRLARYFVYFMIVLAANLLLGKNIGNNRYPWYANVSIFLLLNINIILVLVLFIVLFRNIAKLMADRRSKIFGSRLQTKLVIFIVILVSFPVLITYIMSKQLINTSIDRWFDQNVSRTVSASMEMSIAYKEYELMELELQTRKIATSFERLILNVDSLSNDLLTSQTQSFVDLNLLNGVAVYGNNGLLFSQQNVFGSIFQFINDKTLSDVMSGKTLSALQDGDVPIFWTGAPLRSTKGDIVGAIFTVKRVSPVVIENSAKIADLYDLFRQLRFYSHPVRKAFNVSQFLIALLVIFASIWGSMIFVRSITNPLKDLAKAAGNISKGRFDTKVEISGNDEITYLSKTFNLMAERLSEHTKELKQKNIDLNNAFDKISRDKLYIDTIYRNVDSALFLFDKELNVLQANDKAKELTTLSDNDVDDKALTELKKFITSNDNERIIQSNINLNGENRSFTAHVNKIYAPNKELDNILLVIDDNTHVMNLQRITLWKEIATRITHEIKNPLTPIKLMAERVKRRSVDIESPQTKTLVEDSMKTIITEVDELINLVDEFNMFARMPSLIRTDLKLLSVVQEVEKLQNRGLIEFKTNVPDDLSIKGDRHQIKRVFMNLLQNAVQAMDKGGIIKISAVAIDNFVCISVEDNGCGIPEEDMGNIFVPYFSKKPDGTGLGLAIVKKIVEEHGGNITVESKAGEFTRFNIRLPIAVN